MKSQTISETYFDKEAAEARYEHLTQKFVDKFGDRPDFYVRAPGRVNVIGEHIDYELFSVFPAALSADMVMAVKIDSAPQVHLTNIDPRDFPDKHFDLVGNGIDIPIDADNVTWGDYFKTCVIVASKFLFKRDPAFKPVGLKVALDGTVPSGGGLSSSAAFVVSGTAAVLKANGYNVEPETLQALSTTCEQLVGVNSGGMDQAASIFGEKDNGLLVNFRPTFGVEQIPFPKLDDPLVFLVSNSLVVVNKFESGPYHYNLRVVEDTLAANVLAKKLGVQIPQDGNLGAGTLHGLMEAAYGAGITTEKCTQAVNDALPILKRPGDWSAKDVADALGLTEAELRAKFMSQFPVRFDSLKLWLRAKHVFEEAGRVYEFVKILKSGNKDCAGQLAALINASHWSAQYQYENSHPDVDEIVKIARRAGSLGSRVTGAGWGGCVVHLVPRSRVPAVKEAILKEFYAVKHPDAPAEALIESRPGSGACFINYSYH